MLRLPWAWAGVVTLLAAVANVSRAEPTDPRADALSADVWRRERRLIDMHMHIEPLSERYARAARIMNAAGIGVGVELGSGTAVSHGGKPSELEAATTVSREHAPERFVHYAILDYSGWDDPDWSEGAVEQINKAHRLGAAGLKEFKRLGLGLRDGRGELIKVDDLKLDPVWQRCGELGMPVSIHVGDPQAFWEPLDETNERWEELRDHPNWWFGDPAKFPPRMAVVEALQRVIGRHRGTTFVCVHFGNNPEDVDWVDRQLDEHPNMMIDIAARVPEIGRGDPVRLREFFVKHQDRIVFGSDFQVWERLILGSAGDAERPTDGEAVRFFDKMHRFLATADRDWPHMTPIQGSWTIRSIDLPPAVQRKIYFDNARRFLAAHLPAPVLRVKRIDEDFEPTGAMESAAWVGAEPVRIECGLRDAVARPQLSTAVRALWSDQYLYLAFEAPYERLTMAANPGNEERLGLWDDDVVELFVAPVADEPGAYLEFEWAPNGETLDLSVTPEVKDFAWHGDAESTVAIDEEAKVYRVEVRIPLASLRAKPPAAEERWRANLYRNDAASGAFLAWNPTLTGTAHTPERFGCLEFEE
jgi:predicted TIM-barrel fold metal-dependent hydrolase